MSQPQFQSSPVSNKKSSREHFETTDRDPESAIYYKGLMKEMRNQFVGPMPMHTFIEQFMPKCDNQPALPVKHQKHFLKLKGEKGFEAKFINAVKKAGLSPGLILVDTTDRQDNKFKRKPDISVYKDVYKDESKANFRLMELYIERKQIHEDPFTDPPTTKSRKQHAFEHNTKAGNHSRGQIICYTAAQLKAQNRSFCFSVIFVGDFLRLIRWDRAGAIVTERVPWRQKPWHLATFLWNFAHSSDEARGYDTSISIPTPDEIALAKRVLRQWAIDVAAAQGGTDKDVLTPPYSSDDTFRKFRVVDDVDKCERFFVTSYPQWHTSSPTGRGTKGYEALDIATGKVVYLKDSWRYVADGYEKEGDTYRFLMKHQVQSIPHLICSSDIDGHHTRTHEFCGETWCSRVATVKRHQHHRLVLRDLGRPLRQYNSTKELSQVTFDSIQAHQQAYDAGVLHQDISGGNILITNQGRGLLIDWDLSRRTETNVSGARLKTRTGTWQFMSLDRLRSHGDKPHMFRDDLESFLHVFLYHCMRYQLGKLSQVERENILGLIHTFFDSYEEGPHGHIGGQGKDGFFEAAPSHIKTGTLSKFLCRPAIAIVFKLRSLFVPLYAARDEYASEWTKELISLEDAQEALESSTPLVEIFKAQIHQEDWDPAGKSDCLLGRLPISGKKTESGNKRRTDQADLDDQEDDSRRKKSKGSRVTSNVSASTLIMGTVEEEGSDIFS